MSRLSLTVNLHDFYRYIVLYGPGISDIFFTQDWRQLDFLHALTEDLQQKGYKRILHISPTKPIHVLDSNSGHLSENHLWSRRNEVLTTGIVSELKYGPFGPIETDKTDVKPRKMPDGLGDVNGLRLIDEMMKEQAPYRTALVIYNAEVFLANFSNKRVLGGVFSEWLQLPLENQNSIFFIFTNSDSEELNETIKNSQTPEIKGIFDNQNILHTPQFRIGSPEKVEIANLIHFLMKNQALSLKDLDEKKLVKWLVSEGVLLRTWFDRFSFLHEISPELLRKNGWLSAYRGDARSIEEKLDTLVGLNPVKERILELRDWVQFHENEKSLDNPPNLHMVFFGNPGTGKTTLARIMGEMFHEYGILERGHLVEVKGADLIADVVGGTAVKTNRIINSALDGVLFIDEAYSLSSKERGGFGHEAIEVLLLRMENERSRLVIILAGYPNKMREFLASNPGLERRFQKENRFEFPDFTPKELETILRMELQNRGLNFDEEFERQIPRVISRMKTNQEGFGNGGEVRNLVDSLERRCKARSYKENRKDALVSTVDLPDLYQDPEVALQPEDILNQFRKFVGLTQVKEYLASMVNLIRLEKIRLSRVSRFEETSLLENFVFIGNPGTGKTSVARMVGKIYQSLGLLTRGHTIEVSASNLIAGYVGQTYEKTKEAILNAIDGVLFIDEAYALTRSQGISSGGYGQEAVDILVKCMEDYRDRLVVIAAGYPDEMMNFLQANPGLKSRFGLVLPFEDFTSDELGQIFYSAISDEGYRCNQETIDEAVRILEVVKSQNPKNFGNARDVRRLIAYMKRKLADRIFTGSSGTDLPSFENINSIWPQDAVGFEQLEQQANPYPYVLPQYLIPTRKK